MESLPVRRKSCLLRLRENCPFRKLRRQTYDVSATTSSPIGLYWNNIGLATNNQPISTVYLETLQPLRRCQSVCSLNQSEAPADLYVDPETGERAQG